MGCVSSGKKYAELNYGRAEGGKECCEYVEWTRRNVLVICVERVESGVGRVVMDAWKGGVVCKEVGKRECSAPPPHGCRNVPRAFLML